MGLAEQGLVGHRRDSREEGRHLTIIMRKRVIALWFPALALSGALWAALAQDQPLSNPFANDAAAVPAGMAIYTATCSTCHGEGGTGSSGPALNGTLSHGGSDTELFKVIQSGIDGTDMPSFES